MATRGRPRKYPKIEAHFEANPESIPPDVASAMVSAMIAPESDITKPLECPADWCPGMLLNVRNTGPDYTITLWPEEADPRHPDRALHFTNPADCQNFVSAWYSRQSHDPRAS